MEFCTILGMKCIMAAINYRNIFSTLSWTMRQSPWPAPPCCSIFSRVYQQVSLCYTRWQPSAGMAEKELSLPLWKWAVRVNLEWPDYIQWTSTKFDLIGFHHCSAVPKPTSVFNMHSNPCKQAYASIIYALANYVTWPTVLCQHCW